MDYGTCTAPDCDKPIAIKWRGWCGMHVERWRKYQSLDLPLRKPPNSTLPCEDPACDEPRKCLRWCSKHYERMRRRGTTDDPPPRPAAESRFWARVNKDGPIPVRRPDLGACWLWTGANTTRPGRPGYGVFAPVDRRQVGVHVYSYTLTGREIPDGYEIDHLCMVKLCVNPGHLEAVTQDENRRRADRAYGIRSARTHCPQGHEYSEDNTLWVTVEGCRKRRCRACARERRRRRAERESRN